MVDKIMAPVLREISNQAEVPGIRVHNRRVVEEEYQRGPKTYHISAGSLNRILLRVLPPVLEKIDKGRLQNLDAGYQKPNMVDMVLHLFKKTYPPEQIEGVGWSITMSGE